MKAILSLQDGVIIFENVILKSNILKIAQYSLAADYSF